jgi:SAM-dependent methyltransferase
MTDLRQLQRDWNGLATKDAMWAVLTGPLGAERKWDPDAFFKTGADEIAALLDRLRAAGASLPATESSGRALDFGCGPGRLTQALAGQFARADGVDISAVMVEEARRLNRHGERCTYHVNDRNDLSLFPDRTFDFIYSSITLQHMEPQFSRRYIAEFFRVAAPGGIAVFQIPSHVVEVVRPQTQQPGPLPAASCHATLTATPSLRCAPGATLPLRVMIRNDGEHVWCASGRPDDPPYPVRLGNHWRGWFGKMLLYDDRRTALPFDLAPGESLEVGIFPTAPTRWGPHTLELDMVQEDVRWFTQAGSTITRVRVFIDPRLAANTVEGLPPVMEMHGIPRPEVEALIARAGGEVVAVEEDDAPGPGWVSFRYIARRPPP